MLFTDLADPSTRTVLVFEAALIGLALATAFIGVLVRPVRWLARGLAVASILIGVGTVAEAIWESWTFRYPLMLPDAPFGRYAQPTLLMMLSLAASGLLILVAGVLAFRWPALAGLLFLASGAWALLDYLGPLDPTAPPGTNTVKLVWTVLPPFDIGALLLATWWAEHHPGKATGRATPPLGAAPTSG